MPHPLNEEYTNIKFFFELCHFVIVFITIIALINYLLSMNLILLLIIIIIIIDNYF